MVRLELLISGTLVLACGGCAPAPAPVDGVQRPLPVAPRASGTESAAARLELSLIRELCSEASEAVFLPDARILNSCKGTFEVDADGSLGPDLNARFSKMAPPGAEAANEVARPANMSSRSWANGPCRRWLRLPASR